MKLSELKKQIKDDIYEILSSVDEITMVGPDTEISDIPSIAKTERTNPTTVKAALDQAKKTKQAVGVAESEDEDTTPDEDTLDKQAAAAANKKDSITTASSKLQKLVTKMKGLAKEYKSAEGDKKEKIKDELKKLTIEKKALEKAILPSSEED